MIPLPASLISLFSDNRTSVRVPVEQTIQSPNGQMVCCQVAAAVRSASSVVLSYTIRFTCSERLLVAFLVSFLSQAQTALSVQATHNTIFVE